MPPRFTEAERTRITESLLAAGHRLFTTVGLRRTSVGDLVAAAGIGKGSFYLFFDSKESLYLELMLRQVTDIKRRVIDEGLWRGTDTRDALRRFLRATVAELSDNPLYRRLITHPEEMAAVSGRMDPERLARAGEHLVALTDFVAERQRGGELPPADPEVVIGVLRVVLLLPMHAELFGEQLYPAVLDLLIETVVTGLTHSEIDGEVDDADA